MRGDKTHVSTGLYVYELPSSCPSTTFVTGRSFIPADKEVIRVPQSEAGCKRCTSYVPTDAAGVYLIREQRSFM